MAVNGSLHTLAPIDGYSLFLLQRYRPRAIIDCDGHRWTRGWWDYKIHPGMEREVSREYIAEHYGIHRLIY